MKFNFWKFGTFVILGFLLVGLGILFAQTFSGNLLQQSNGVASKIETNSQQNSAFQNVVSYPEYSRPTDTKKANVSLQSQNNDSQKQTNIATSKQRRNAPLPPIYVEPPQIVQQPQPRFTVEQLKSRVMNESESVVTSLLGYTQERNVYSVKVIVDKYDANSLTYRNIAYDSNKRVVDCTIYFELKNKRNVEDTFDFAVDWSSRREARRISCF